MHLLLVALEDFISGVPLPNALPETEALWKLILRGVLGYRLQCLRPELSGQVGRVTGHAGQDCGGGPPTHGASVQSHRLTQGVDELILRVKDPLLKAT